MKGQGQTPKQKTLPTLHTHTHNASTHAAKVLVQQLHISVDQLQGDEFIVLAFDGAAEVEAGIPSGEKKGGKWGVIHKALVVSW